MSATLLLDRPRAGIISAVATLTIGVLMLGVLFWPEARAAFRVWNESTAYGHCYLVVPIALYLAWDRRDNLRGLTPAPTPAFALLALPIPFVWLAAERLGIMEIRQFAAIAAIEVLFLAVLGLRLFTAVSGPLLYLVFLVPFGAFLTPVLQSFTAWFIDVGLTVLGIPHFINEMTIEIAAGTFFVAEACAGLRFLIASIAFGVFFALLNYNSPGRRAGFIIASIVVPIVANGMRALGIVVLGQVLGDAQAAAADHLIYGWFFFSFVTLLLVIAGLPFREPLAGPPPTRAARPGAPTPIRSASGFAAIAGVVLVLTAAGPAAVAAMQRSAPAGHIAETPGLIAPAGCVIMPRADADQQGSRIWSMNCAERSWTITLLALPGTSTGAALTEARDRLVGPVDAEEAVRGNVQGAPGWRTTVVQSPGLVAATAAWIGGQPATGGIAQRIALARNSVFGGRNEPAVMAIVARGSEPLTQAGISAALQDLSRFVAAQPALDAEVASATRPVTGTSSPPPRS